MESEQLKSKTLQRVGKMIDSSSGIVKLNAFLDAIEVQNEGMDSVISQEFYNILMEERAQYLANPVIGKEWGIFKKELRNENDS
jgi:hypothetical protein